MAKWRDILGYEGYYKVSNEGEVRSVDRYVNTRWDIKTLQKGSLMNLRRDKDGYLIVTLRREGKAKTFRVSRLVASAFIPNPSNLQYVNHLDGVRDNNHVDNLEWCTQSHNIKHSYNIGLKKPSSNNLKGSKMGTSKLTEAEVLDIRRAIDKGCKQVDLANKYNVSISTISAIKHRRKWNHI